MLSVPVNLNCPKREASGILISRLAGYGIFRIPEPVFDLMALLTFIYLGIWTIRKRMGKKCES